MDSIALRWLCRFYRLMLHAYPSGFRRRYGDEMCQVFQDRCREALQGEGRPGLVSFILHTASDWSASVVLERVAVLRPVAQLTPVLSRSSDGVPVFYMGTSDVPTRSALIQGSMLSLAIFAALTFTMAHWGNHPLAFLIGAHRTSPGLLGVHEQSSAEAPELTTEVKVAPEPDDPWRKFVAAYFDEILVLRVLDANGDLVISAAEIAAAPARLRKLDFNHDGKLDAEECGLILFREPPPDAEWPKRAGLEFMRFHPVLAALDADHDGEISASEIANASAALTKLDKNHDGQLTPDELIPPAYRQ